MLMSWRKEKRRYCLSSHTFVACQSGGFHVPDLWHAVFFTAYYRMIGLCSAKEVVLLVHVCVFALCP